MNTRQNYAQPGALQNPVEPTDGSTTPAANSAQPTAKKPFPILLGFDLEVSVESANPSEATDAYLLLISVQMYRDQQLKEIQDEYRFCRANPGREPNLAFVERVLATIVRLNTLIQLLTTGIEDVYRELRQYHRIITNQ